jgi:hypothetical protein
MNARPVQKHLAATYTRLGAAHLDELTPDANVVPVQVDFRAAIAPRG